MFELLQNNHHCPILFDSSQKHWRLDQFQTKISNHRRWGWGVGGRKAKIKFFKFIQRPSSTSSLIPAVPLPSSPPSNRILSAPAELSTWYAIIYDMRSAGLFNQIVNDLQRNIQFKWKARFIASYIHSFRYSELFDINPVRLRIVVAPLGGLRQTLISDSS